MKSVLYFLAHVFACVVISVYSLHLFIVCTNFAATHDAQYAVSFMASGAWGWVMGVFFYLGRRRLETARPGSTKRFLAAAVAYAVILVVSAVAYEATVVPAGTTAQSLYILIRFPLLFGMSLMGLTLLPMMPKMWLAGLSAFVPPALVVTVVYLNRARAIDTGPRPD